MPLFLVSKPWVEQGEYGVVPGLGGLQFILFKRMKNNVWYESIGIPSSNDRDVTSEWTSEPIMTQYCHEADTFYDIHESQWSCHCICVVRGYGHF